mmetsp:Transcript_107649/g.169975  ORF Transcript_107649/g.169975 Transcript_107649/m.169975 type:complete len:83 (-) Transcript_107649:177-425(-)|eukprot:CAMPEP_0169113140 /NCGR_PEP_ID=MMETSP1015-20121227/28034_1 /TAXON_ID=342587 /ORGANISM="Karlodinium micrum, Strain CCMP2283" /LENGTH=82 /DNA_ID=CAMNT_0009175273 /DNA_START=79 /DNA_END=327 /DNA_ORIENTATION=-
MFDLVTLVSAMGLQQELNDNNGGKVDLVLRDEETNEPSLLEQAANSMSSAFESFETSLSFGMASVLGTSSPEDVPMTTKQVA